MAFNNLTQRLKEQRDYIFSIIILLILNIFFINDFFMKSDLYNSEPIYFLDNLNIISYCVLISEIMIPATGQWYGYNIYTWAGLPYFPIFPFGIIIIVALLSYTGLELLVAYKVFLFSAILFQGIFPFFIVENLTKSKTCGLLSSFWLWVGTYDKFWFRRFSYGAFGFQIGFLFIMLFYYHRYKTGIDRDLKTKIFDSNSIILISLLSIAAFFHYVSAIFLGIIIVEEFLIDFIQKRKITPALKLKIKRYFLIALGAILINAFWLFPIFFINIPNISLSSAPFVFTLEFTFPFVNDYLKSNWLWLVVVNLLIPWLYSEFRQNQLYSTIVLMFYNAQALAFILPITGVVFFTGNNAFKYLIILEMIGAIIFGITLKDIFTKAVLLFKRARKLRMRVNSKSIITILMCGLAILTIYPFKINNFHIESNQLHPNDEILFDWLENSTDKNSRILFQNPLEFDDTNTTKAYMATYLAISTDRYFVSGFAENFPMEEAQSVNFIQDSLFNRDISTITLEELEKSFNLFNIEHIIVSHGESLGYFANLANKTNKFQLVGNNTVYYFYRYLNATRSFVLSEEPLGYENFRMDSTNIQFDILSYSFKQKIIISLHDYVNWRVYINGVRAEKEENQFGLIQFSLIDQTEQPLKIEIFWEKMEVEYVFNWISSAVFLLFLIYLITMKKKESIIHEEFQ